MMNKKDLVNSVSSKTRLKKCQGARVINALMDLVGKELKEGNPMKIPGFGTFGVRCSKRREFVNPRTKKTATLQSKKIPIFCASTTLKRKLREFPPVTKY